MYNCRTHRIPSVILPSQISCSFCTAACERKRGQLIPDPLFGEGGGGVGGGLEGLANPLNLRQGL